MLKHLKVGTTSSIQIHPKKKCTCPATTDCVHVLAVLLSINIPESELQPEKKTVNLTLLRKNARGKKKPGRKRPRQGDVDVEPAPDSSQAAKVPHK